MRLTFRLRYHTNHGQSLWLTGKHELFRGGRAGGAIPLEYLNGEFWQVTRIVAPEALGDACAGYSYLLREPDGTLVQDWGGDRPLDFAALKAEDVLVVDSWNPPGQTGNVFYTEPFTQVLLKPEPVEHRGPPASKATHIFRVKAPLLGRGQRLCLLGSVPALRQWSKVEPVLMNRPAGGDCFSVGLDLSRERLPLEYKYGIYDAAACAFVRFEEGANRTLPDTGSRETLTILNDGFAALPGTAWRGAGVAVPVFSLRSDSSFGVGEFSDLKPLADWCRLTGLKMIQILPVNDTCATHGWKDSYPYSAISAFALHPVYLNLSRVVTTAQNHRRLGRLEQLRKDLNGLGAVDYEAVMSAKLSFLKEIFPSEKKKVFGSKGYRLFLEGNRHWLEPYAAFCFLRDQFGTADFTRWPRCHGYKAGEIAALAPDGSEPAEEMDFHRFLQYHLHTQLLEAAEYAHSKGVILKGDIAIGVYRSGADAWEQPDLFHQDMQAGAPPDAFATQGQNWAFPTYNWPRMKATGFDWWARRFEQMGRYFDAFRIDHILGFFRIWSIPLDAVEGILGHFVPCLPVQLDEFASRGIRFDRDRFLRPYITDAVLRERFGAESEGVKERFLDPAASGRYELKPQVSTQRRVEDFISGLQQTEQTARLRQGLFDLISNVILLDAEGAAGREFHFRFGMETTSSFRDLDEQSRTRLKELYVDYFYRRQEACWRKEGTDKLAVLKRVTNMLVCGEDLGMVPACVPEAMKELGLLSLEVQRMPKRLGKEFSRPAEAPYLSVVTPSTHDMSTLRGWWKEDRGVIQRFFNQELGRPGRAPDSCESWVSAAILAQHAASPAMWAVFQLQDLLGIDERLRRENPDEERINVPANPNNYWRYRMHLTLEQLIAAEGLNGKLRDCVRRGDG
ncbi:MAG: 4-alpha-glucanotransferase [Limisphaerales bacterium]